MQLKISSNNFRCIVASKCLNINEQMDVIERNKDGPHPSVVALRITSLKENPNRKKIFLLILMDHIVWIKIGDEKLLSRARKWFFYLVITFSSVTLVFYFFIINRQSTYLILVFDSSEILSLQVIYLIRIKICNMSKCGFDGEIDMFINNFTFKFFLLNKMF